MLKRFAWLGCGQFLIKKQLDGSRIVGPNLITSEVRQNSIETVLLLISSFKEFRVQIK
jgi:hypothetical protein